MLIVEVKLGLNAEYRQQQHRNDYPNNECH